MDKELKKLIVNDDWYKISKYQHLSELFIEKYADKVNWYKISIYQHLSESFIEKYSDKVDWEYISKYQHLSESFIEKYADKVNWDNISIYQHLSESFIEKYAEKVNWYCISKYQHLSESFIEKYKVKIPETCWIYKSNKFKLEYLKKITKYEIIDDEYIIAYKGIRSDNYSVFNFLYKYKIGKSYTAHCDCNVNNESSFGLSAWTLDKAKEYCNEKIIKVKI